MWPNRDEGKREDVALSLLLLSVLQQQRGAWSFFIIAGHIS